MRYLIYRCLRLMHGVRHWAVQHFTPMGFGVVGCLCLAAIAGFGTTQSLSHLLFFFAVALLGLALVGSRLVQYHFRVTRTLPRFGTVGEPLQYPVVIHNLTPTQQQGLQLIEVASNPFPSFRAFLALPARSVISRRWRQQWGQLVARQQSAIAEPQALPPLASEAKTKVTGEILPLRRGRLTLDTLTLACPDPLGLLYKRQTFHCPESVCILPQRYTLPPLQLSKVRRHQQGDNVLISAIGEALEFRSLRDYRPGDPTNKIHWKSWAKVGRPIVKEQQEESAVHHALILDSFQPDLQFDPYGDRFEEALRIAISFLMQDQPEASRLDVLFATPKVRCVTVGRGLRHRAQLLETLATLTPCPEGAIGGLTPLFQTRASRLSGCFCILLNVDEDRLTFLKEIAQFGVPIKALILCEQTLDGEPLHYRLTPNCQVNLVAIDRIQEDLRLL